MNHTTPRQKKVVNTLSVRLPPELYSQIAEIALERGETLNSVFIQMVELGLTNKANEQKIIEEFVLSVVSQERMRELINGKASKVTT